MFKYFLGANSGRLFARQKVSLVFSLVAIVAIITNSQAVVADKLVLVAAEDSIPTSYTENGVPTGILVDVINEAFERAGYSVEVQLKPWARCQAEAKLGIVDGIFSIFDTAERREFLNYADEVLITQVQAFFVPVESTITFDGDIRNLANNSIGVINLTSYGPRIDGALENGLFKHVDQAQSSESNLLKLLAGRVDIIPSYLHVVLSTAKALGVSNKIRQLSPNVGAIPSYLAFTKKRDFSKVIIDYNRALASMKKDGTYDDIFDQYLFSSN